MEEVIVKESTQNPPLGEPSGIVVQTQGTVTGAAVPDNKVTKVIVAVHGVGDQHTYATIQSVVNQFCSFYREPTAIPLGSFYTDGAAYSIQPPYPTQRFQHLAFAEVYLTVRSNLEVNPSYVKLWGCMRYRTSLRSELTISRCG